MAKPDEPMARSASVANTTPLTITALCRRFGLSRSTLLYYDRIGLLTPSARTDAGHRLYSIADIERLKRVMELRAGGLSLEHIHAVLDSRSSLTILLQRQLLAVSEQMQLLCEQQHVLLAMLGQSTAASSSPRLSKQAWTEMFQSIGMSDDDMWRWHAAFEQSRPEAHQDFLESLGISAEEVARIRARSRDQME